MGSYEKIIKEFVELLKKSLKRDLISVIVFGSYVKGSMKEGSDIDFLIIVEKEKKIAEMEKRKEELLKTEKRLATPIVQEKEIRQRLGLGKPGEKVIFISSLGESDNSLLDEPKKNSLNSKKNNPQKWWDYFFSKE